MEAGPRIERALLSAWRKEEVAPWGRFLHGQGVEILSTGGTARALREAGVPVVEVSQETGHPEIFGGRVKTLHPKIHGGLLMRRDDALDREQARGAEITGIDLLIVDLYPFAEAAADPARGFAEVVEMIDIGGPAMIRSAAKNHAHVAVVTDPADGPALREELEASGMRTSEATRRRLAAKAFRHTATYDAMIAEWLGEEEIFPAQMPLGLERVSVARYGENPHQAGALYRRFGAPKDTAAGAVRKSGKEMSYNNLLDASAALEAVRGLPGPAAVVVKHRNPCGAAVAADAAAAFEAAYAGDPLSAFGGIVALNRPLDAALAARIATPDRFLEVVLAPRITDEALAIFRERVRWGKSVRLLESGELSPTSRDGLELRSISGGILVQEPDRGGHEELRVVAGEEPDDALRSELLLAWQVCQHAVSNAVALVREGALVGLGAGQTSRVEAVEIAARKAGARARGAVMASEAFFPFPDGVLAAAEAGVRAVIQPGGSRRDEEVIAAARERGMTMVFTGRRHFRH